MAFRIIFALTLAGFALLLLAERLGLPPAFLKIVVLALFVGGGCAIAISVTQTHYKPLFQNPYGYVSAFSLVLGMGVFIAGWIEPLRMQKGDVAALSADILPPLMSFALSALIFSWLPNLKLKAARECLILGSLLLCAALLMAMLPFWFVAFEKVTSYGSQIAIVMVITVSLAAVLGGHFGVNRLSAYWGGIFICVLLLPLGIEGGVSFEASKIFPLDDFFSSQALPESIIAVFSPLWDDAGAYINQILAGYAQKERFLEPIIFGIGLAWLLVQNPAMQGEPKKRFQITLFAVVFAGTVMSLAAYAWLSFSEMIRTDILASPSSQWPNFVFDEALRGWLSVCGISRLSADDVFRTCKEMRGALPSFQFDTRLNALAWAHWRGWPNLVGEAANLLMLMLMLSPVILLLSLWGSRLSELIASLIKMPLALKASLISWMRLSILIACSGLIFIWSSHFSLPKSGLLGLCLVAFIIITTGYMMSLSATLFAWVRKKVYKSKASPASPTP